MLRQLRLAVSQSFNRDPASIWKELSIGSGNIVSGRGFASDDVMVGLCRVCETQALSQGLQTAIVAKAMIMSCHNSLRVVSG